MNIYVIYPHRNISKRNHEHRIYPYLLRNLTIDKPNMVWSTDITYIPLEKSWVYLTAIVDWHTRAVLSWRISSTCDRFFCIDALEEAIRKFGSPEIVNTDQGSTYTSPDFTKILEKNGIKISMDGKGRALDNIIVERFWRTLKYDEVYLNEYRTMAEARLGIEKFIDKYNNERPHSSCGKRPPMEAYLSKFVA